MKKTIIVQYTEESNPKSPTGQSLTARATVRNDFNDSCGVVTQAKDFETLKTRVQDAINLALQSDDGREYTGEVNIVYRRLSNAEYDLR